MDIEYENKITKRLVTAKYKKLAKLRHPDKDGGDKNAFQELQNAFRRIIAFLEKNEISEDSQDDFETDFFTRHNIVKECTNSIVIYIQDAFVQNWRQVLEKHLKVHREEKSKLIMKTGGITITLYEKPKKDPRSKLHIQSGDQKRNFEFVFDSLSLFYREVCTLQGKTAVEDKSNQKSVCPKCGKQFVNKKGLKQHIQRMHTNTEKSKKVGKSNTSIVQIMNRSSEDDQSSINNEQSGDIDKYIQNFIVDLPFQPEMLLNIQACEGEDQTSQCNVCGKLFLTELEMNEHMNDEHTNSGGIDQLCDQTEIIKLLTVIKEKENYIKSLSMKNDNLVKANVALDKENKRTKLAFYESQREKVEIMRELNVQRESLAKALKENTVLNEEVHVKAEFIKVITKELELFKKKQDTSNTPEMIVIDTSRSDVTSPQKEEVKCNKCNYKTKVRSHLKGHMLAHSGQYQCQQGCKDYFKTWAELDEHHNVTHGKQQQQLETFDCDKCDSTFKEAHQLRTHKEKKHTKMNQFKCDKCHYTFQDMHHLRIHKEKKHIATCMTCERCGEIFKIRNEFETHRNTCDVGFKEVRNNKECYYFKKGSCFRGDTCTYKHEPQGPTIRECRNGTNCRYLRNGVCCFFHRGVGVQSPRSNCFETTNIASDESWCKFNPNCNRIPNCPYLHSNQDFPKLPKIAKPPFWHQNIAQTWQDY